MNDDATEQVRKIVETVYRTESRQVLATLIRLLVRQHGKNAEANGDGCSWADVTVKCCTT